MAIESDPLRVINHNRAMCAHRLKEGTMKIEKIAFTLFVFMFCLVSLVGTTIAGYPEKEVRIIVNYGVGGGVDRTARSIQRFLPDDFVD